MKKGIAKYTAFCMAAGLVLTNGSIVSMAAGPDLALVGLGTLNYENSDAQTAETAEAQISENEDVQAFGEEAAQTSENEEPAETAADTVAENTDLSEETAEIVGETDEAAAEETVEAAVEETAEEVPVVYDTSVEGTTGFAQCEEYLNVRTSADTDSEVVGKIYPNGSLEIIHVEPNGWYQVRSGNVEGYVSADYVATGDDASAIASSVGYTTAEVNTDTLNVRASATTDSDVIAMIDNSHDIEVVEDQGDWVKVLLDGEMYGYLSADYVSTTTEYATGETLEEEQARLDQQWLDYLAQQEAEAAAAEAAWLAEQAAAEAAAAAAAYTDSSYSEPSYDTSYTEPSYTETSSAGTTSDFSALESQVSQLYQNYLDAQAAADAAVANGADEQTIIDTAASAQAAYAAYLSVQNELDNAYAGITTSGSTTGTDSYEGGEDDGYEDDGYEDDGYEDDGYEDDGYEDDSYDDGYDDDSYDDGYDDGSDD